MFNQRTNSVSFLHDLVTAEVLQSRTYAGDVRVEEIQAAIGSITKRPDDSYVWALAGCVVYTRDLKFRWTPDVPESFRALEQFWKMIKDGAAIADWWGFYATNVDNVVLIGTRAEVETQLATLDELTEKGLVLDDSPSGLNKVLVRKLISPEVVGWHNAVERGMKVWSPPKEWKLLSELTPEERGDPN